MTPIISGTYPQNHNRNMDIVLIKNFFLFGFLVNIGIMMTSFLFLTAFREFAMNMHSKIMGVQKNELPNLYFRFFAYQKLITITLFLTPYLAICIID